MLLLANHDKVTEACNLEAQRTEYQSPIMYIYKLNINLYFLSALTLKVQGTVAKKYYNYRTALNNLKIT
jgi:hypothetical protein